MADLLKTLLSWVSAGPLKGYRTQLIWVVAVGAFIAKTAGVLDQATYDTIQGVLVPTGLLTAAYKKV